MAELREARDGMSSARRSTCQAINGGVLAFCWEHPRGWRFHRHEPPPQTAKSSPKHNQLAHRGVKTSKSTCQDNSIWDHRIMALSDVTDPASINAAMDEFDRLGRDVFLRKYGFGGSRVYFLRRDGKDYDSKAIVGEAHGFQHLQKGPLHAEDFSGGERTVRALLEGLGFSVETQRLGRPTQLLLHMTLSSFVKADPVTGTRTFPMRSETAHKRVHEALRQLGEVASR